MNKLTKEAIWLLGCFVVLLVTFSCEEDKYYPTMYEARICKVPKFYNEKQGFYKGETSFILQDSSITFTCSVEFGNYESPTIIIHNFPAKLLLDFAKYNLDLAEEFSKYQLSESILNSNLDFCFRYYLYGFIPYTAHSESFLAPSEIDSTYHDKLYFQISKYDFTDSLYNEDKSQKIKYEIYAENYTENIISFALTRLEINGKPFSNMGNYETQLFARIKVGDEKITGNVP